eukprot:CAMPEP_0171458340 /NCGR_PEP_ID=MMETSP0945-20130129/4061_1 /TAXON_ID=109269 /ORGANISM="Vaucheria litorea, Strain CCMP2940" /LENGTH=186 /DNA_ID=CAMNT_0011984135 /DNA_START=236 /DNA_END=793 /DNA_ORIENTATION=+
MSQQNLIFVGVHLGNESDTALVSRVVNDLNKQKRGNLILGVGFFPRELQSALDSFVETGNEKDVENLPFLQACLPLLKIARESKIKLLALGITGDSQQRVFSNGLEGLSSREKNEYVSDLNGFVEYESLPGFRLYAEEVIFDNFKNFSETENSFKNIGKRNYFAERILSDEAVASKAVETVKNSSK